MEKQRVTIFIVCHKPVDVISNDVYKPIHVGRAISKYKNEMSYMIGDDTGENISDKNPYFCELTAQYWAWKNYNETEYIGFCHYRRFFKDTFTNDNIEKYFQRYDVILVGPRFRKYNRINFLNRFVCYDDITILFGVVKQKYPEYYKTMCICANDFYDYPSNMLVCKKKIFDEYAQWLFDILFECEKHIKLSPYSRARRIYGYLSEFLMMVYFVHHKHKIKGMESFLVEKKQYLGFSRLDRIKYFVWRHILFANEINKDFVYNIGITSGLKSDGIYLSF